MDLRTPVGRARGLGSARYGTEHWWVHRMTSVALVPLTFWMVWSMISLAGAPHAEVVAWIGQPLPAVLLILLLLNSFHHMHLALQVVFEDYIHNEPVKIAAIIVVRFASAVLAAGTVFAVLKIALGG